MSIKKRKAKLAELTKSAQTTTELQQEQDEGKADVNLADIKDPQEYAHKVFEMLLNNIKIEE